MTTIAAVCAEIDALRKDNQTLRMATERLATERDTARAEASWRRT